MKGVRYNKDTDSLTIKLSRAPAAQTSEIDGFTLHYSKRKVLVMLEVKNAVDFLESVESSAYGLGMIDVVDALAQRTRELTALSKVFKSYVNAHHANPEERRTENEKLAQQIMEIEESLAGDAPLI